MNFQDAEKTYRKLKKQHTAGKLTDEEFEAEVTKLWCQDEQERWWLIGVETGEWYRLDGENWIRAQPPTVPAMSPPAVEPPPSAPAAPPSAGPRTVESPPLAAAAEPPSASPSAVEPPPSAPAAPPSVSPSAVESPPPTAAPVPPPARPRAVEPLPSAADVPPSASPLAGQPPPPEAAAARPPARPRAVEPSLPAVPAVPPSASSSAVAAGGAEKGTPASVMPARQENVSPVDKTTGMPRSTVIGIAGVVAFVVLLIVVSGYFILSSVFGGKATARTTTTPTLSLALLQAPTPGLPSDTPQPSPTSESSAAEENTPTQTPTRPTATRRPPSPTPAGPTATATLNIPPGVYVTNIETIPPLVNVGDTKIGFKVSFLNTTGSIQTYNWSVKWYQCPDECQDFRHSHGETLTINTNLAAGTMAVPTSLNINIGTGISCDLIAVANYVDPVTQQPTPFQATKNNGRFAFSPCH